MRILSYLDWHLKGNAEILEIICFLSVSVHFMQYPIVAVAVVVMCMFFDVIVQTRQKQIFQNTKFFTLFEWCIFWPSINLSCWQQQILLVNSRGTQLISHSGPKKNWPYPKAKM